MNLRRLALAALIVGVASWLVAPLFMDIGYDGNTYVATGHGWSKTHELVLQWGDVLTFDEQPPGHSHHFPPAYPLYLGVFFTIFGYGLAQAKIAAVVAGLLALAVVYVTSRDLYGRERALLVAALVATCPWMLWIVGMGFSESLALLFFTLTMWAIIRSLTDERFIVLAGIFAGIAYLSRASMGSFFVIAGGGGLLWRLYHRGIKSTVTSKWYGLAIVCFALIFGAWAYRNVALFGWPNWETSPGSRGFVRWILDHPRDYSLSILGRIPLLAIVYAPFLVLLWPEARRSLARIREEHTSGLWLSVGLIWFLGIVFSAIYFSMGLSKHELLRLDNMRYVLVGLVPLAWALLREADLSSRAFHRRFVALLAVFAIGGMLVATFPAEYLSDQAARAVDPYLRSGDRIAVGGAGKYPFYAYLSHPEQLVVYTQGHSEPRPEFIFTFFPESPVGYTLVHEKTQHHWWWPSEREYFAVWARDDVAAARAIPMLEGHRGW